MAGKKVVKKNAAESAGKKVPEQKASAKLPVKKKSEAKSPAKDKALVKHTPVPVAKPVPPTPAPPETRTLTPKEVSEFKDRLLMLRERISGEFSTLSRDNLEANQRDASLSDQGTDTFDREMELNMMGSEQEVLFEIDAALRRIEAGTFGICELTGLPINIERLQALPYVRYTVRAQSELEKGRARYRPLGGTMRG